MKITEQSEDAQRLLPLRGERAGVREVVKLLSTQSRQDAKAQGKLEISLCLLVACRDEATQLRL